MGVFFQPNLDLIENQYLIRTFNFMNFPAHFHNCYELLLLTNGTMCVTVNNHKETINKGDIAIILPNEIHSYMTEEQSEGYIIFCVDFSPDLHKLFLKKSLLQHVVNIPDAAIEGFYEEYKKVSSNEYAMFLFQSYLYKLFYKLLLNSTIIEEQAEQNLIRKLLIHVEQEYDKGLNLNEAAAYLGMSRAFVSKFFKSAVGCGFNEYIGRLKIEKSKVLLLKSDLPILDVALECGFENQRSYNRVFRKYENTTPSVFKKSLKGDH